MKRGGVLAVVLVLAGCGSSSSSSLTPERYAEAANSICRDIQIDEANVAKPNIDTKVLLENSKRGATARRRFEDYRRRRAAVAKKGMNRVRALEAPEELRSKRDEFFEDLATADALAATTNRLEKEYLAARRRGDKKTARSTSLAAGRIIRRQFAVQKRLRADAEALGWRDCAGT